MKKQIKTTEAIFPMPVLLIATFNEEREARNRGGLVRRCPRQ